MEKVSVIIPTYNRFKYLLNAIKSVQEQTYKNIEIIFLYPWAIIFNDFLSFGPFIFIEMVVFLGILAFGFIYAWRNGVLDWE